MEWEENAIRSCMCASSHRHRDLYGLSMAWWFGSEHASWFQLDCTDDGA